MKDSNSQLASEFLPEEPQGLVAAQGLQLDCLVCMVIGDYKGRKGRVRKITNMKVTMALTVNGGGHGDPLTDPKDKYDELLQPEEQVQIMQNSVIVERILPDHDKAVWIMQSSAIVERILPDHDKAVCLLAKVDEPALLIDPGWPEGDADKWLYGYARRFTGSEDTLAGSQWTEYAARVAADEGLHREVKQIQRNKEFKISGVGKHHEVCTHEVHVPITMVTEDGRAFEGSYGAPVIDKSQLPALLGLKSMTDRRVILDFTDPDNPAYMGSSPSLFRKIGHLIPGHICLYMTMTILDPGVTTIEYAPGPDTFSLEQAFTRHQMLPCTRHRSRPPLAPHLGGYGKQEKKADMALYKEGNASASSSDGNTEGILPDSVYSYIYDAEGILPDSRAEE